jgi:hypothetical protein
LRPFQPRDPVKKDRSYPILGKARDPEVTIPLQIRNPAPFLSVALANGLGNQVGYRRHRHDCSRPAMLRSFLYLLTHKR